MLSPLKQPAGAHLPIFQTLNRHSKPVLAPTGEGREESVHDRELHAEGHLPLRLFVVKMLAGSYLPKQKSILSDQKGLPEIFFLVRRANFGKDLEGFAPGREHLKTSEWCKG
jgi:hypothetical protein